MRLSTKGRYGVTAMMDLAIHDNAGPVTLADISQCQGISLSYLEQLFSKLRKHGLVDGVRGPGGGYKLARSPENITVAEIIAAVDERVDITNCGGKGDCQNVPEIMRLVFPETAGQIIPHQTICFSRTCGSPDN